MSSKKNKKFKNNIIRTLFLSLIIVLIAYVIYRVISLIAVPSNSVVIENGLISQEESVIRLCYKRRTNSQR